MSQDAFNICGTSGTEESQFCFGNSGIDVFFGSEAVNEAIDRWT